MHILFFTLALHIDHETNYKYEKHSIYLFANMGAYRIKLQKGQAIRTNLTKSMRVVPKKG